MRGLVAVVALAACSGGDGAMPDATPVDAALIDANPEWTGDFLLLVEVGALDDADIRIDGEPRNRLELHFDGEAGAATHTVVVENVVVDVVASRWMLEADCDAACGGALDLPYYEHRIGLCAYASGELRMGGESCDASSGFCIGDGFCWASCSPDRPCPSGYRCALDRLDGEPSHGWNNCVAIGPRALGESCAIDLAGIDDCGAGLYCVAGTCRAACYPDLPGCDAPSSCTQLDGMSPGILACLPPAATSPP